MKLLLTSNGISNDTIADELALLAEKPFNELKIAFIPTAGLIDPGNKSWLIDDMHRLKERGATVDIVDIAQITHEELKVRLEQNDVVFAGGGNTFYLSYHMEKSGLFDMLPDLLKTKVYAGISAGSMVMGATLRVASHALKSEHFYDSEYEEFGPNGRSSSRTYGAVDFAIRPHLNSRYFPEITEEKIQWVADQVRCDIYAIDDNSAISLEQSEVKLVSEGEWMLLSPK